MADASAGRKKLDVTAAGRAAAIAINGHRVAFALAVGAAILAAFVRRAIASNMSTFLFFVSHSLILLLIVAGQCVPLF